MTPTPTTTPDSGEPRHWWQLSHDEVVEVILQAGEDGRLVMRDDGTLKDEVARLKRAG
jgi:hypothetical protein